MNKRFKELAKDARLLTGWPVGEVEYQKFAELIVQECVIIADRCVENEEATYLIGERLKQHFDIK